MGKSDRIDVYFIAGGKYHDIDFARLEILKLLAEQPRIKVRVGEDYSDIDSICAADFIISYTCDISPTAEQTAALCDYVRSGKNWFALHGTNSILRFLADGRVDCPEENPPLMDLLGSQFMAHPPIQEYTVQATNPKHPLVKGIPAFTVDDELYLSKYHGDNIPLLHTTWSGEVKEFARTDWDTGDDKQLVFYLRPYGNGQVLYLTLGHCRGKYDMQPLMEEYPAVEKGAWKTKEYYELLRRGIEWAIEETPANNTEDASAASTTSLEEAEI